MRRRPPNPDFVSEYRRALDDELRRAQDHLRFLKDQARSPESVQQTEVCRCPAGADCDHHDAGYDWCRPHGEHHRPPECPVDHQGNPNPVWAESA